MIGHLFKLVWNRRRANALVLFELFLSFLVVCGVLTIASDGFLESRQPLGFRYDDVWVLTVAGPDRLDLDEERAAREWETFERLRLAMRDLDEVEAFSPLPVNVPFSSSTMASSTHLDGVRQYVLLCEVLPDAKDVLGFEIVAGRWLERGDADLVWEPVVINRAFARALFGGEDPLGKPVRMRRPDGTESEKGGRERRVVGVISAYRQRGGMFDEPFAQFSHTRADPKWEALRDFVLRVRPGVPASFEEELLRVVHGVAPDRVATVTTLAQMRRESLRESVLPLAIAGIVAGFLLLMVGLGLVGVLWQSVSRRTEELGLRRALGASARQVRGQVLGELLALTTVAVGLGSAVYLQLPILGVLEWISLPAYLLALTLALVVIYPFVALCGLYPSWMATRARPAEALQYE